MMWLLMYRTYNAPDLWDQKVKVTRPINVPQRRGVKCCGKNGSENEACGLITLYATQYQ